MRTQNSNLKMVVMSMLVALGVVISPILRVEGMCPMAHLINIVAAVLLGPWYAFFCAISIGLIRMIFMGIPPLALTGAIFGALFSGLFYKYSNGRLWLAVLGEILGTGIIGAIVSYPIMTLFWGRTGLTWMFYVPSFLGATIIGGSIAYVLLFHLQKTGHLKKIQRDIGELNFDINSKIA